jgi:hypothetical protein
MNYGRKLNSIVRKFDLESDVQRKQAYIECVKYADKHYANTFDINPFLKEAAEILKQEYIVKDAIYCMTPFDKTEKVMLEYTKSHGPTMTANKSGLIYLSNLLLNLSKAKMMGEHIHLRCDKYPMSGKTFPLTIYIEDDDWFSKHDSDDAGQKPEPKIEQRDIDPFSIVGVVFTRPGPPTIQLEPLKFYKILQTEKYTRQKVWKKKIRDTDDRLYVFTFLDDSNVSVRFALDLDDKEIFFLSQKDLGKKEY